MELLHGTDGSFDAFYTSQYRPLLRIAWAMQGRRDLAEDAVQDAMLSVHQRWSDVGGYDKPGAYARRILLNGLASQARRRDREQRALQRVSARESVHVDGEPPDGRFWDAVRSLPVRQAQALVLRYVEDRSVQEIAEVLDIAEGTVKVHLHRGRLALFDLLGADYREEGS